MSPSRRRLLRAGALSIVGVAGCRSRGDAPATNEAPSTRTTDDADRSTTDDTDRPTTDDTTTDTDTETSAALDCGVGPLPDAGWPLPERSVGRTNYAPTASGPTDTPGSAWTVTAADPERGEVRFTRPTVADGRPAVEGSRVGHAGDAAGRRRDGTRTRRRSALARRTRLGRGRRLRRRVGAVHRLGKAPRGVAVARPVVRDEGEDPTASAITGGFIPVLPNLGVWTRTGGRAVDF